MGAEQDEAAHYDTNPVTNGKAPLQHRKTYTSDSKNGKNGSESAGKHGSDPVAGSDKRV